MPDEIRRIKIKVGEYGSGDDAIAKTINYYTDADLVLGMRFHSNVTPIGLKKETIGLKNYPQINNLYFEIDKPQKLFDISEPLFHKKLLKKVNEIFTKNSKINKKSKIAIYKVKKQRDDFSKILNFWLKRVF